MGTHVGSDVGALCRRCGDVWHVIVAIVEGRVAKVECKQCGAQHRFRSSESTHGTGKKAATSSVRRAARRRPAAGATMVKADPSRAPRRYVISETYQAGDRILHGRFGEGVVQDVSGPGKAVVLFGASEKTLVHGRAPR
jgi:hypothetical protein